MTSCHSAPRGAQPTTYAQARSCCGAHPPLPVLTLAREHRPRPRRPDHTFPFTPKAAGMLGTTWSRTLDGALDHIATQHACMSNALDDIGQFLTEHPEHDGDPHLTAARIALL